MSTPLMAYRETCRKRGRYPCCQRACPSRAANRRHGVGGGAAKRGSLRTCLLGAACLRRQPFSSLEPAAGQNIAAVCGLHALTEAMDLFPLALFGLIGLKHGSCTSFPFGNDNPGRRTGATQPPFPPAQAKRPRAACFYISLLII